MASPQEREGKSATSEGGGGAEGGASPSKMKLVAHYAMLGVAAVVAVAALVVAALAFTGNQASQEQLDKVVATTDSLNTSLAATKSELERLRFAMAHDKSRLDDELAKQEAREAKIIQSINQLQVKLKISPTLGEQLLQAASAPAAVSAPVAASSAASAVPATGTTGADKKTGAKMQTLREAIEKMNKQ